MKMIYDLRSDTVTLPSQEMRDCALTALVGDDVFGEDPSVNELQIQVSNLLGKEAALFVPSGTMGNLISVMTHCWGRGGEVFLGDQSHIYMFEQGGISQLGGVHPHPIPNFPDGTFSIEEMKTKVRVDNVHFPVTSLVCIENTHNLMGGSVLPLQWLDQLYETCAELKIPVHMDGARLFNAAVALNINPLRLVEKATSVNICLSKGLGAPVGSVIAGPKEFIERATRVRKVLGGGMRQCGILAKMGSVALKDYEIQLKKDHLNTQKVAKAIAEMKSPAVLIDMSSVQTNMIFLKSGHVKISMEEFCNRLEKSTAAEIKLLGGEFQCKVIPRRTARLVMHRNIAEEDIENIIKKITFVIKEFESAL